MNFRTLPDLVARRAGGWPRVRPTTGPTQCDMPPMSAREASPSVFTPGELDGLYALLASPLDSERTVRARQAEPDDWFLGIVDRAIAELAGSRRRRGGRRR